KEPLISNEQLGFGGFDSVRGYLESQVFVDDGVDLKFELRSPSLAKFVWQELNQLQLLAFVDAAKGQLQDPLPGQNSSFFLWSTGLGMKVRAFDGLNATIYWAYPLRDNGTIESGDSRFHFATGYQF
ncbi:MAG: ShlB/FhaC/HecB family hemolysin secretion/activation protein, partial [Pseudomonadota bacterium]